MGAKKYDCIIIGAGPGGLTAGIYLKRFRRSTLVIDGGSSRVSAAPKLRNLVGYDKGISGDALIRRLKRQAREFNVPIVKGRAAIRRSGARLLVELKRDESGPIETLIAKRVIIATGFRDVEPPGFMCRDLCRMGLLAYCPICDGYDHTDEAIGVLINSNAGFRKLKFIYGFSKNLHAVLIKDFRIAPQHKNFIRVRGITLHKGELLSLGCHPRRQALVVRQKGHRPYVLKMAYIELGFKVPRDAFKHLYGLKRIRDGRIQVDRHQQTSIHGLYAVGDCTPSLAQVSVAVGEAAIAATHIHNQLSKIQRDG